MRNLMLSMLVAGSVLLGACRSGPEMMTCAACQAEVERGCANCSKCPACDRCLVRCGGCGGATKATNACATCEMCPACDKCE